MPPLEAWEKVFLDSEPFFDTLHGRFGCIACHGGTSGTDDMEAAHEGMVRDPDSMETCVLCHAEIAQTHADSLHWDLEGYLTVLAERSDEEHWPQLMVAYETHCANCHASCGQCHVSRPTSAGSGLLKGHSFREIPPMNTTCTGCHGSRIEEEYKGKNEMEEGGRYPADVHYNPGGMPCFDCHSGDEMHGALGDFNHRYDSPQQPSCSETGLGVECHADVGPGDGVEQHDKDHLPVMSCETCHSVEYKHCYSCHVQKSEEGVPFFRTDPSQMMLKIGRNPIPSPERPWEYVLVRHVPIARDTFVFYGEGLLPNFDARPTWTYATPHNSQLQTPQNESCNACHGNPEVFLTADDVAPDELEANKDVIVTEIPAEVER